MRTFFRELFSGIFKNTLWLSLSQVGSKILTFFILILVARLLGPEIYGKFAFAFSFALLFSLVADLGLSNLITREIAQKKEKAREITSISLALKIILSLGYLLFFGIFIQLLPFSPLTRRILWFAGIYTVSLSFSEFIGSTFYGFERMQYQALMRIGGRALILVLLFFAYFKKWGVVEVAGIWCLGVGIEVILGLFVLFSKFFFPRLKLSLSLIKEVLKESLPFALTTLFVTIYFRTDTVMLSLIKGDLPTGWYNASYRIMEAFGFIPGILSLASYPVFSKLAKEKEKIKALLFRVNFLSLIFGIPVALGGLVLARDAVLFLYGKEFEPSSLSLRVLLFSSIFMFLSLPLSTLLNALGRQRKVMKAAFFCAGFNVFLNFLLIPYLSELGAAISTLFTEGVFFFFVLYRAKLFLGVFPSPYSSFFPLVSALGMVGVILIFSSFPFILLTLLGVATYFLLLLSLIKIFQGSKFLGRMFLPFIS